jgi:hypothetical protein
MAGEPSQSTFGQSTTVLFLGQNDPPKLEEHRWKIPERLFQQMVASH